MSFNPPIKILIVDDSYITRQLLTYILEQDPTFEIIGEASNGLEALKLRKERLPDLITMDINMPLMDGLEATRLIMSSFPVPIVIVSADCDTKDVQMSFDAIAAGAVAIQPKPVSPEHPDHEYMAQELRTTIKLMAEIKLVTRRFTTSSNPAVPPQIKKNHSYKFVVIGVSTGGPMILKSIFSNLQENFPLPILVVQHIVEGFLEGMVSWLEPFSKLPIHIAQHNERPREGHIYFAPDHVHLGINMQGLMFLSDEQPVKRSKPSVSYLFGSLTEKIATQTIAILLSGMGNDGAHELKKLKELGALTLVQDEESSVIFGMPKKAIQLGAATRIVNPQTICQILNQISNTNLEVNYG